MPACSLNEIEAYARRAARGAGLPWGLADEAGRAARWLSERGQPGAALMAELLASNDGRDYALLAPMTGDARWHAAGGWLCPVCTGAALSDRAGALAAGAPLQLGPTTLPLLLAPFLAQSSTLAGGGFELRWAGARVQVGQGSMRFSGDDAALRVPRVDEVTLERCAAPDVVSTGDQAAVLVDESAWTTLGAFAYRTYVPASEASRSRGAGAGTTDND